MKQKLHLLKSFQVFDRRCTKTESANHRPGSLVLGCAVRDAAAKLCFTCKQCMYVCSPPTNRLDYCRQCRYASPRYNMKHLTYKPGLLPLSWLVHFAMRSLRSSNFLKSSSLTPLFCDSFMASWRSDSCSSASSSCGLIGNKSALKLSSDDLNLPACKK